MSRICLPLISLTLAGCSGQRDLPPPISDLTGNAPAVPVLIEEQAVIPPLDAHVVAFGMGDGPQFLTRAREGSPGALIRFGPGRTPQHFARTGDGPGEVRDAPFLAITDSALVVFDFANARFGMWDRSGTFIGQTRLRDVPLLGGVGRAGEWLGMARGPETLRPVAIDGASGRERNLLAATDSFLNAELGAKGSGEPTLASVGRWDGGFLVANGRSYRIGGYDWEGRLRFVIAPDVPPNLPDDARVEELMSGRPMVGNAARRTPDQWRERFRTTPEQWFSHLAPPRMDAEGRVWVIGRAQGQMFADAWWRDRFLGRTLLECPGWWGRWNLAGYHIALPCANNDPESDVDHVYRVWRIEADSAQTEEQ